MSTIILDTIKASQPIGLIYVTKISPELLLEMSSVDRRRIADDDEVLGIQRELRYPKVAQIKSYISSVDATFPNSIIVNTTSDYFVNENEKSIELKIDESTFTIIDGQHRVEGFRDNPQKNFELIVAIFKDLKKEQQAEVFSTINSQQTKVDPSHNLNLELDSKVFTPIKMMIQIAQSFNFDKDSPWYNNIRLLGSGSKGILSLSAFVKPLLDLTYPDKDYYKIKNELTINDKEFPSFVDFNYNSKRYLFWEFYTKKDQSSIFKILLNFFKSLAIILDKDWLNTNSLLNKTTGYNAMIKLFRDLFIEGYEAGDLSYEFFYNQLTGLRNMNGTITSENYGASGAQATNELYLEMKKNANQPIV
jgi:DGQHR domain-containing protein